METNIEIIGEENIGGSHSFEFTRVTNLTSQLVPIDLSLSSIPLRSGAVVYKAYFRTGDVSFRESDTTVNGQDCSRAKLSFTVPKDSLKWRKMIATFNSNRYVIAVKDMNDQVVIMGNSHMGCKISADINHGSGTRRNEVSFSTEFVNVGPLPMLSNTASSAFTVV